MVTNPYPPKIPSLSSLIVSDIFGIETKYLPIYESNSLGVGVDTEDQDWFSGSIKDLPKDWCFRRYQQWYPIVSCIHRLYWVQMYTFWILDIKRLDTTITIEPFDQGLMRGVVLQNETRTYTSDIHLGFHNEHHIDDLRKLFYQWIDRDVSYIEGVHWENLLHRARGQAELNELKERQNQYRNEILSNLIDPEAR